MLTPRAILFDLDNTLYHWNPCDEAGRQAAFECLGEVVSLTSDVFLDHYRAARSHFRRALKGQAASHDRLLFFQRIAEQLCERPEPRLALAMSDAYVEAFLAAARPQAEARRVLETLGRDHALALVSNHTTRFQLAKVDRLGFTGLFQAIVTSEEAGAEKPDPRVFQLALERLGATPAQALMVGDHAVGDIGGAHGLGLATIHTREFSRDEAAPGTATHVITSLEQVLDLVGPAPLSMGPVGRCGPT